MFISFAGEHLICNTEQEFPYDFEKIDAVVADFDEDHEVLSRMFPGAVPANDEAAGAKYENLYGFDRLFINRPERVETGNKAHLKTEIYINQVRFALYSQDASLRQAISKYIEDSGENYSGAEILRKMFIYMFSDDSDRMNQIEDNLAALEISVIENENNAMDITKALLDVRKTLLSLHRYYSAMFDMLEDLEENLNGIFTKEEIMHFRIHTNKADRLLAEINHLQEYATQVREAYQSQLDIRQNKVMQFFTVVTSIFFPLTLLTGWYGMNFKMPEYEYLFSYPIMIVFGMAIVISLLIYFKKKKWF